MPTLLVRKALIIDPERRLQEVGNIFIRDGRIDAVLETPTEADYVLDADGLIAVPGFIDIHTHLREPGDEEAETIASGAMAAVRGGFTTVCTMANTEPPIDSEAAAEFVVLQSRRAKLANVYPIGAVTDRLEGERLSEMGGLVRGGAVAFSDDGNPIRSAEILRRALLYAKMFDKVIIEHCEDPDLSRNGVMHSGGVSTILGLPGMPSASEEIVVARDIKIAEITDGRLHIAHLSTAGSVELLRDAKRRNINVTGEVTPHHLTLTDETVMSFNPNFKMKPPLRTEADKEALIEGLADGTIDIVVTDHAPHTKEAKEYEFPFAPFGVIGLETAFPILYTHLVAERRISLISLVEKMTLNPAKCIGFPSKGRLSVGADADITLFETNTLYTIDPEKFASKSRNTPFAGASVRGRITHTIVAGRIVYEAG